MLIHLSNPYSGLSLGVGVRELGVELPSQRVPMADKGVELTEGGVERDKGGDASSLISGVASLLREAFKRKNRKYIGLLPILGGGSTPRPIYFRFFPK